MVDNNETLQQLLDRNILELKGDTDEEMASYVRKSTTSLTSRGSPPITINITSNGGSVPMGLYIYDFLRLYQGEKVGRVLGFARSMAAVILQACNKREATANSHVLIHHVSESSLSLDQLDSKKKIKRIVKSMRADQERLYKILEKRTKRSRNEIVTICKEDRDMSAEEALAFGLIDEII